MSNHRKTVQHGTPGDYSVPATGPASPAQPPGAAAGHPQPAPRPQAAHPEASGEQAPPPSSDHMAPELGHPSQIPPPAAKDDLSRTPPPPGGRTPELGRPAPDFGSPLPDSAPGWMLRARRLSLALEQSIREGKPSATLEACVERAWVAWELDGSTDKQIARVAQLLEKAHTAIREASPERVEHTYHEVAQVVWAGLPRNVKARTRFESIVVAVRHLRQDADPWAAVVDGTSRVLGWSDTARAHAAHAIRVALTSAR